MENGTIDAIDLYSTDAEIQYYDLRRLSDDLNYFPDYEAVILYREDLVKGFPGFVANLLLLEGTIDEMRMTRMNARSKLEKVPENQVAAEFLTRVFSMPVEAQAETMFSRLLKRTREHLLLVLLSI